MRRRGRAWRRGQTLVLFALSTLLLTLMVLLTLSIGARTKEKMELQTMADASAYSNAVATARAFNSIAVLNRVQIAQMVALAGNQSLISWSSFYISNLTAGLIGYSAMLVAWMKPPPLPCIPIGIIQLAQILSKLWTARVKAIADFETWDARAGAQSQATQLATMLVFAQQGMVLGTLTAQLTNQNLANDLIKKSFPGLADGQQLKAHPNGGVITACELLPVCGLALRSGAILPDAPIQRHAVHAAYGSRDAFMTMRGWPLGDAILTSRLTSVVQPRGILVSFGNTGSAYYDDFLPRHTPMGALDFTTALGRIAMADDHGTAIALFRGVLWCPRLRAVPVPIPPGLNYVRSPGSFGFPLHQYFGGADAAAVVRHRLQTLRLLPPSIWPHFVDYNPATVTLADDIYGQPKNYAVLERTTGADPWALSFRFGLSGTGEEFDSRGVELKTSGESIERQVALATGITYYHRGNDHWSEPPNFFNPFWRAGLVHPDIDADGKNNDIPDTMNQIGFPIAADAYKHLKAAGFVGWQ